MYVHRNQYGFIEVGGELVSGSIHLTDVGGDVGPFTETLPGYIGDVKFAFLDLNVGSLLNTHAGFNGVNGNQYVQYKKSGGEFVDALLLVSDSLRTPNTGLYGCGRIYGQTDIHEQIVPGDTFQWKIRDGRAFFDGIIFEGPTQLILRLYLQ